MGQKMDRDGGRMVGYYFKALTVSVETQKHPHLYIDGVIYRLTKLELLHYCTKTTPLHLDHQGAVLIFAI